MIKKLFFVTVFTSLIFKNSFTVTYNSEPKIFIAELVQDAIKTLSDKSISDEDKKKAIEKIALENVDIRGLGMYTLGDARKTLDKDTLNRYNKLFERYFLKSLTSRLNDYASNKFEVIDADQKSSNYTIVQSRVLES